MKSPPRGLSQEPSRSSEAFQSEEKGRSTVRFSGQSSLPQSTSSQGAMLCETCCVEALFGSFWGARIYLLRRKHMLFPCGW